MVQHFLIGLEYFVLFKSSSTHFSVAQFHSFDVKDHITLLIFRSQRDLKAKENTFKNNLLVVYNRLAFMSLLFLEVRMSSGGSNGLDFLGQHGQDIFAEVCRHNTCCILMFIEIEGMCELNAPVANLQS